MTAELITIPASYMRGGTSKGVFLLEQDMPEDRSLWGPYLLDLMGARSIRQITGMGGSDPTTSKCCIIGRSINPDADIVYTFAQIGIGEERIRWDLNCGNLSAAVGVFAIRSGLVEPVAPQTKVRTYQVNTRSLMDIRVPVGPEGPVVDGPLAIGGVPGTGAPVSIDLARTVGASLKRGVFPTGQRSDVLTVEGVGDLECSIVDVGNMCVFFRPEPLGFAGTEGIEQGAAMMPKFRSVREAAQRLLGVDYSRSTPWAVSVTAPKDYELSDGTLQPADAADLVVRFIGHPPRPMHQAYPGTATSATAVAAALSGTVVNQVLAGRERVAGNAATLSIGHASGVIRVDTSITDGEQPVIEEVSINRTVNPIMDGTLYLRRSEIAGFLERLDPQSPTRAAIPTHEGW